nr:O-antigen ligase family protein [uncultured Draconibacterium sp.]
MLKDFKKAFLIYAFLKILLNQNINLVNIPGIPLLTIELFCNLCFAIYFFSTNKNLNKTTDFPLRKAYRISFISIFLSTIVSTVGFNSAITRTFQILLNDFIFAYILWNVIIDIKDIRFLIKGLFSIFLFLTIYGFFEKLTGLNPFHDYVLGLNKNAENVLNWSYDDTSRLGMGRVKSAIIHPIGLGIILAALLNLFLIMSLKYKQIWKLNTIKLAITLFLGTCVLFFTNSRSPLVFFVISFVPFLDLRKKYTYQILFLSLIIFIIGYQYIAVYFENITSLFSNSGTTSNVGGSSLTMRIIQFYSAYNITSGHYTLGLGIKSLQDYLGTKSGILGAESIWIQLLVERGVLGILAHLFLIYSIYKLGVGKIKLNIHYLTIGWLLLTTITSTPGVGISFFLTIVTLICKAERIKNNTLSEC